MNGPVVISSAWVEALIAVLAAFNVALTTWLAHKQFKADHRSRKRDVQSGGTIERQEKPRAPHKVPPEGPH